MTDLPVGWEIKRLDEIANIVMGQSPPGSSYNETGEGQPFFQGKAEFGEIHPTVRKYTTSGTKFAKAGDILMSVRAPVGPTNIADVDCVIGRGLAAIRANNEISQSYLRWTLKHLEIDIQSKGTGTTFDAITGETLRSTLVSLPPLPEQHKIVEILEDHLARLDASVTLAEAMERQSAGLRRSLLQAAFTGKLTKEVASV
jgi:type I restriction enzyme S subunit